MDSKQIAKITKQLSVYNPKNITVNEKCGIVHFTWGECYMFAILSKAGNVRKSHTHMVSSD